MSIVDILKSLDELAKAITQKNIEVDELKKLYNHKISIINQYVELLDSDIDFEKIENEILEMELVERLEKPIVCENCNNSISLLDGSSKFALIPKSRIRQVKLNKTPSTNRGDIVHDNGSSANITPSNVNGYIPAKLEKRGQIHAYNRNQSKKTCSYCNKPGHTRAKCFTRLNKDG